MVTFDAHNFPQLKKKKKKKAYKSHQGLKRAEFQAEELFGWGLQCVKDRYRIRVTAPLSSLPDWLGGEYPKLLPLVN